MSTGDLVNNVGKLLRILRQVNYSSEVDIQSLSSGKSSPLLRTLHHVLLCFSLPLSNYLSAQGYELFAKSDLRFVQEAYKVFRNEFKYRPRLTVTQFLNDGFAERKIIMMCEVIQLCLETNRQLMRTPLKVLDKNAGLPQFSAQLFGITGREQLLQSAKSEWKFNAKGKDNDPCLVAKTTLQRLRQKESFGMETANTVSTDTVVPHKLHSPSDVKHHDTNPTAVACSVQQHYSKQTRSKKDICAQETAMKWDICETLTHPLRQWKLEQTAPASSSWSSSGSSSSLQDMALLTQVTRCRSPIRSSHYQAMQSLQPQSEQCTLPLAGNHTDGVIDDNCPIDEAHEGTTHSLERIEDRQQTSYSPSVHGLSGHFRNEEENQTTVHDLQEQKSVRTQGTQTDALQELQLLSIKVDKVVQSLLTLEARLTLTETRLKILEERQDDVT